MFVEKLHNNPVFGLKLTAVLVAGMLLLKADSPPVSKPDPLPLFQQVANKLNLLKSIKYHYKRELNYPA